MSVSRTGIPDNYLGLGGLDSPCCASEASAHISTSQDEDIDSENHPGAKTIDLKSLFSLQENSKNDLMKRRSSKSTHLPDTTRGSRANSNSRCELDRDATSKSPGPVKRSNRRSSRSRRRLSMTDLGLSTESVSRTLTDRQGSDSPSESEDEGSSSNSCKRMNAVERDRLKARQGMTRQASSYGLSLRRQAAGYAKSAEDCVGGMLPPVLVPTDDRLEKWDNVIALGLALVAVVTPMDVAFLDPKVDAMFVVNRITDVVFLLDLLLQFNMAIPNKFGRLMKTRREIRDQYLQGWFVVDALSVLPWDVIAMTGNSMSFDVRTLRFLRMLRLIKMLRLVRGLRIFVRVEARYAVNYSLLQLYGFLLMLFLLCHWLACGWYMVIVVEESTECVPLFQTPQPPFAEADVHAWDCCYNWLDCFAFKNFDDGPSIARKYFLSMVWSTGEVLTVGSSIAAVTDAERAYMLVTRIISGVTYAYLLGSVCSIFTSMTKEQSFFYESMDKLNGFLRSKLVNVTDPELCGQLRMFYRFVAGATATTQMQSILGTLSPSLRGSLAWTVHSMWLKQLPLFRRAKLPPPFFVSLAIDLEVHLFAPLEVIIESHSHADSLYVVEKGIVLSKGVVKTQGDVFGEDAISAFRDSESRGYQATAFTHGSVYLIKVDALVELMARPQYQRRTRRIFQRIARMRLKSLLLYFHSTLTAIADANESFADACLVLEQTLSWVHASKMHVIKMILARVHQKIHLEIQAHTQKQVERLMLLESNMDHGIRIRELLKPFQHQIPKDFVKTLSEKENLDEESVREMTPEQLHGCGMSMGAAIAFVKFQIKQGYGPPVNQKLVSAVAKEVMQQLEMCQPNRRTHGNPSRNPARRTWHCSTNEGGGVYDASIIADKTRASEGAAGVHAAAERGREHQAR